MKNLEPEKLSLNLNRAKRKVFNQCQERWIETEYCQNSSSLPLVIKPTVDGLNLIAWASSNKEFIESNLLKHGGLLFRNFNLDGVTEFEEFIKANSTDLVEYSHRSTPRSHVSGKIYTSTEYPANQSIPLHNELSWTLSWPMKIWFFCMKSAEVGGQTPIADSRKVYQRINSKIKEQFMQKKVMYVRNLRNFGDGLDLPWQNVFQTTEKSEAEDYCRQAGIEFEWIDSNHLRTRQVCQAVATHPKTGDMVWFNQAHLFHVSSVNPEVCQSLVSVFSEKDFPRNAYYGDGSEIETSVLDEIRDIYQQEAVTFPWQEGDVLMLDNMLAAHGRMPYTGTRKVLVGMAELLNN
ncbi:TauD/TfdA family dioxygenase [Scytonema sp. UIC 10036]|uniref:TauD/TfdA family dioxygenase n=1 Tax=Scytonema sp. UIC 10036 TaxID=2304196 RepID=UPI0012DA7F34|nr:TauD/TfdA family dioxygenase [Scytonema sp. UIC 10036]MUG96210.1 TauD/TfdA family dioxygenase [Scytonema sp. UIC 10036]